MQPTSQRPAQERGWPYLLHCASESDRDLRKISLVRGYAWVEHALEASGLSKQGGGSVAKRLLAAQRTGNLGPSLREAEIREAISLRHRAAHEDTIPAQSDCEKAIRTLAGVWIYLREAFVVLAKACDVATRFLTIHGILEVCLYGSLSRRATAPRDIDLLVFDDGSYSDEIAGGTLAAYIDRAAMTRRVLEALSLRESVLDQAAKCRWMDIMLLNKKRFMDEIPYRKHMASVQPDPYFFLNISSDVLEYSLESQSFREPQMPVFEELRRVNAILSGLGFQVGHNRPTFRFRPISESTS